MDELTELADQLHRLREADTTFRVLDSDHHRYTLGPTLSGNELAAFEADSRDRQEQLRIRGGA